MCSQGSLIQIRCPNHLNWGDTKEQRIYSDVWAHHNPHYLLYLRAQPTWRGELSLKSYHDFTLLVTKLGEGWKKGRQVKQGKFSISVPFHSLQTCSIMTIFKRYIRSLWQLAFTGVVPVWSDPEILELVGLQQWLTTSLLGVPWPQSREVLTLTPAALRLSCRTVPERTEVTVCWSQLNHLLCK